MHKQWHYHGSRAEISIIPARRMITARGDPAKIWHLLEVIANINPSLLRGFPLGRLPDDTERGGYSYYTLESWSVILNHKHLPSQQEVMNPPTPKHDISMDWASFWPELQQNQWAATISEWSFP